MSKTKAIIKDSIFFSGSTYITYVFKIVTSLTMRRFLTPAFMGLLSELMIWNEYAKSHHLGVLNALDREIPYYRGKGDLEKVSQVKKVGLNFSMVSASVVALLLLAISACLYFLKSDKDFTFGLLLVAILIIVEVVVSYYRVILRTDNKFMLLSKFNVFFSLLEAVSTVGLIILFGYKGVLFALIFTSVCAILYLLNFGGENIRIGYRFKISQVLSLLKIGFPLYLYELIRTLFLTIDRLMIIFLFGRTPLGYYSIATMAYNFLTPLPRGVYNVLFPKFYEAYGKTGDIEKVKHYLIKPTMIFAYLFPVLIGISSLVLPLIIQYILPKYREGLFPAQIFIFSTFFYSLLFMWQFFLIALYKQIKIVQFNLVALILCIVLNYLFAKTFRMGLSGIALGTMLGHFLLSTIVISYVFRFYSKSLKEHLLLFLKFYFPIVWVGTITAIFMIYFNYKYLSLLDDALRAGILICILIMSCLPLLYYVNKQTNLLTLVYGMIKRTKKET